MINIETLSKFLSENGIEIPEGTDSNGILKIVSALLNVNEANDSSNEDDQNKNQNQKENEEPSMVSRGVA